MATLEDLTRSILVMSDEEALQLILERRESRLIFKASPKKNNSTSAKSPRKKKAPKVLDHFAVVKTLSPDQAKHLLDKLQGKLDKEG